ncbi:DNA helicase IV [Enterovibrio norvegicus FF-33]|uniref:DNA 3'-5' helicase n=1 Tax=Enterovibrio norvegicus FF-454 TaxID=1185651 RepID=A0A1E5C0Z1_9GAMM|nr:DNA helicase IV [Enterovibrio norvegicus]OEE59176.1 DNA helicase IV [Enterovibrio norvegicus FF-454]OEE67666.1 DNA helicase IV [Enterovibrio norvegicus FF-33]
MKLSASKLAQWCVQGDHYSIALEEHHLVFESKHLTETVPFAIWDGQCRLSRGLLWGKLTFIVSPADQPARSISVYGLPWFELSSLVEQLTASYQDWLAKQKNTFMLVEHELVALRDELEGHKGYLRDADLQQWVSKAGIAVAEFGVHPQVASIANPALYQGFFGWLQNGSAMREAKNTQWRETELERWSQWFDGIESSPLNPSQRQAVLMDDNHNLLLAGAGSGKTSVLMARTQYLVASEQTTPERIVMLAFGKKASEEMAQRLASAGLRNVEVSTFHSFATKVIKALTGNAPVLSALATDEEAKLSWMTLWLAEHLTQPAVEKRWLKHLSQWKLPGLNAERKLAEQAHEPRLHKWLWRQVDLLIQQNKSQAAMRSQVNGDARAESEFALVWPLMRSYQTHLSQANEVDFNGLIKEATKLLLRKSATFSAQYDHIMVDEYQDISPSRMEMLEALCGGKRERAPSLFAVGDDWQAIYRFAGSDVSLTTDFLARFPAGVIRYLDVTYRFHSQIGAVANPFIQVNPRQLAKPLNSVKTQKKKAVHLVSSETLEDTLTKLAASKGERDATLMMIGRNHASKPEGFSSWQARWPSLNIVFVTAHASKGLEADFTFLLDVNEGVFPAKGQSEGLEVAMLSVDGEMEHAEERRLFYVALTRARQACWIFCHPEKPSVFVKELWQGDYPVMSKLPKKALEFEQAPPAIEQSAMSE